MSGTELHYNIYSDLVPYWWWHNKIKETEFIVMTILHQSPCSEMGEAQVDWETAAVTHIARLVLEPEF